ncbi:hypothetical protein Pyn_06215 [Prunus yedoensis var. nudiflora]|uniref:Uncharacterized protein n=1 Tax=Prunus yedoensis var. nudiflora TaxID=2094558 RepID=A0A314XW65_PRUYE|nr:hypothetical protein Pyn_06215 [Prunus yedoensis var. nudiflora]
MQITTGSTRGPSLGLPQYFCFCYGIWRGIKIQTGQFFRPKLVDALKGLPCKQLELVSGSNFCLVHGEQHDEFQPRAI